MRAGGGWEQAEFGGGSVGGGGDVLVQQIVGVLPRAGVVVAFGGAQAQRKFDAVAAMEWDLGLGCVAGIERGADAADSGDGDHARGVGGDVFDGSDGEVDGGSGRAAGFFPLVPIEVAGCGTVLRDAWGQGADADDAALDGAAEAVGIGKQRGLR